MLLNIIEKKDIDYIHKKASKEFEILGKSKIFITGASGFLSYYFIKSILEWNDKYPKKTISLIINSRFSNGLPKWINENKKRKDLTIIKGDINKISLPRKEYFNYIIHAASIASPILYRKYPIETMKANVDGLTKILDFANQKKYLKFIKGILYFSSSEIYGDPLPGNIPTSETYRGNVSCTGPRACYDESN